LAKCDTPLGRKGTLILHGIRRYGGFSLVSRPEGTPPPFDLDVWFWFLFFAFCFMGFDFSLYFMFSLFFFSF